MDVLRNSLPAGLTVWKISNECDEYMQRSHYTITTPTFECKKPSVEDARVAVGRDKQQETKEKIPNMLQQLAMFVEDMYPTFTFQMKKATDSYLREQVLEFVMSESGHSVLGPKRCREVVAYMGTPMLVKNEPFFVLCSFLLDARIVVDHQVYTWNHNTYPSEVTFKCKI